MSSVKVYADIYGVSTTFVDVSNVCIQRRRRALFVPPPTRLELQESPYLSNTEYQLNMRRKAEIFKYANPTTGKTRKQAFSQLANTSISNRNYTQEQLQNILEGNISCIPTHNLVPTPSTSCDVPGPVFDLYLDTAIPLYNYSVSPDAASQLFTVDKTDYLTYITNDFPVSTTTSLSELFVLYINNNIKNPLTNFSFKLPFTVTSNQNLTDGFIANPYVYCYYNSKLISTNDTNGSYATKAFLTGSYPTVQISYYPTNVATVWRLELLVNNFLMTTTPGFILDIKTILVPMKGTSCTIVGNPTGGSGLVLTAV